MKNTSIRATIKKRRVKFAYGARIYTISLEKILSWEEKNGKVIHLTWVLDFRLTIKLYYGTHAR